MSILSHINYREFLNDNYFSFLLLGGLLVIMLAYRNIHPPATRNYIAMIIVLFIMNIAGSFEAWARNDPSLVNVRVFSSVIHYIMQPLTLYLEVLLIIPGSEYMKKVNNFVLAIPVFANTIIYLIAPFTGTLVFCYDENYYFNRGPLGYSIFITTFIYLALLLIWSFLYMHQNRRRSILLFFIGGIAILTGILEYLNIAPGHTDESFAVGIFIYYVYLMTVHVSDMETKLVKNELELTQNKVRILREQIQPHFLFNSLYLIKALIRKDQGRAIQAVEDFSDYLHANLDAISSDNMISFEDELTHIDAYVSLALADKSKNMIIEYDIKEKDFFLPPLSVEPIVENAIRHGLKTGDTVKLSSYSDDENFIITVKDNGHGFDPGTTYQAKKRTGIGVKNVEARLATICNGTMSIVSSNSGTSVTIRLPKKNTAKISSTTNTVQGGGLYL